MKINKVELYNIGPYLDKNTFQFTCSKDKHIVLIGGKNGAGKTTFFKSIKTCLYGCKVWGFDAPGKEYYRFVENLINAKIKYDSSLKAYIEVELEFDDGKQIIQYILRREWVKNKKGLEEVFSIHKNGKLLSNSDQYDFMVYLLSLIPPDMFNFYFFDGESIADFFLGSDGSKNFRNAFLKLYGLDTLSIMIENFERYYNKSDKKNSIYDEYLKSKNTYQTQQELVAGLLTKKNDLENKIDLLQIKIGALRNDYKEGGGISLSEWKELNKALSLEESKRDEINRWIKDVANNYLPFIIVEKQLHKTLTQLQAEQEEQKKQVFKEVFNSSDLNNRVSEFLSGHGIDNGLTEKLLNFIGNNAFHNESINIIYDFSSAQFMKIIAQISEKLNFDKNSITKALRELDKSLKQSKNIRESLLDSSIEGYEEFNQQKDELENAILSCKLELEQLNQEIVLQQIKLGELEKECDVAKKSYEKLLKDKSINEISQRAIGAYTPLIEKLVVRQSKILQEEFIKNFTSIINKENFIDGIVIDKNINVIPYKMIDVSFLQLDNYLKTDSKTQFLKMFDYQYLMDVNDLRMGFVDSIKLPMPITAPFSQGERQVYIMSLYLALLKTSRKDIPFFLDTPFARIDSDHREKIIKEFFNGVDNQIFVLSTDEEMVGEYVDLINDHVSDKYRLDIDTYGKTSVTAGKYFEVNA